MPCTGVVWRPCSQAAITTCTIIRYLESVLRLEAAKAAYLDGVAPNGPGCPEMAGKERRDGGARGSIAAPSCRIVFEKVDRAAPAAEQPVSSGKNCQLLSSMQ